MAEVANQAQQEYWSAPLPAASGRVASRTSTCPCGTEFIVSSLYCHACGASRPNPSQARLLALPGVAEIHRLGERLGLNLLSVAAFLLGLICVFGAFAVSVLFSAHTLTDWQAIQLWRIEWLLGAIAAFAVGCLVKK